MAGLSLKKLLDGDIEIWTEPKKLIVRQMVRSFSTGATTKFQLKKGLTFFTTSFL